MPMSSELRTVQVDARLHQRVKVAAATEGIPVNVFVSLALTDALQDRAKAKPPRKKVLPAHSSARV
jgi:predicted HicB family RNase H-like nuclease